MSSCNLGSCGFPSSSVLRSSYAVHACFALLLSKLVHFGFILRAAADSHLLAPPITPSPPTRSPPPPPPSQPPRNGWLFSKTLAVVGAVVVAFAVADVAAVAGVAAVPVLVPVAVVVIPVVGAVTSTILAERRPLLQQATNTRATH